jgi:hypothetical protein
MEQKFNFYSHVGKLNIAGLGAVWQARRQQSRDIAVNGLHVALNTTCRFAYRNRSSATKGLQKLSSFSRQSLPKKFWGRKANARRALGFPGPPGTHERIHTFVR